VWFTGASTPSRRHYQTNRPPYWSRRHRGLFHRGLQCRRGYDCRHHRPRSALETLREDELHWLVNPLPSIPRTSSFAYPIRGQIACSTKRHLSRIRPSLPLLYSRASSLKIDPLETKRFLNRTGFKPIDTQRRRTPRSSLRCTIGYL
jgi:hypothetical protein